MFIFVNLVGNKKDCNCDIDTQKCYDEDKSNRKDGKIHVAGAIQISLSLKPKTECICTNNKDDIIKVNNLNSRVIINHNNNKFNGNTNNLKEIIRDNYNF